MADLERILQQLHDSEIRCGIQAEPPAGGITAWIDYGDRAEKARFFGSIVGGFQNWPANAIAIWLHVTAMRLHPESKQPRRLPEVRSGRRRWFGR
jgi:hypothetical protein